MKEINLGEIINYYNESNILPDYYHRDDIKYMLRVFGKQLLELAAENSKFKIIEITDDGGEVLIAHAQEHRVTYSDEWIEIDKQSILDTIKQVKL